MPPGRVVFVGVLALCFLGSVCLSAQTAQEPKGAGESIPTSVAGQKILTADGKMAVVETRKVATRAH